MSLSSENARPSVARGMGHFLALPKRMRHVLLLLIALIASCAPTEVRFGDATDDLRPYVEEFAILYGRDIVGVTYDWGEYDDRCAQCLRANGELIITVDRSRWDDLCEAQKIAKVFHELGHCLLNRDHVDTDSYMFPRLLMCDYYEENREALDQELFSVL